MPVETESGKELYFRGRSEHVLDAKGRLNIPTRFRDVLVRKFDERLMVTNWDKCLQASPVPVWEKFERELLRQQTSDPALKRFTRYVISGVTECALDKQGRILLPPALRTDFGIDKDVILTGMLDKFEIWNKEAWETEWRGANNDFGELSSQIAHLGI